MATIEENLRIIKEARYGRDMRLAIHDAIEQVNDAEVETSGKVAGIEGSMEEMSADLEQAKVDLAEAQKELEAEKEKTSLILEVIEPLYAYDEQEGIEFEKEVSSAKGTVLSKASLNILGGMSRKTEEGIKSADVSEVVSDGKAYGVEVDFTNRTFTRIGDAVGKTQGADFDGIRAYQRRRCNLSDDGRVLAYYGDANYKENGSNGQVMIEQPLFYYKVEPLILDGQNLRKARYYISDYHRNGFKVHPAFVRNGKVAEAIYLSAYEGSTYDTSASGYNTTDAQTVDFNADKLSSIANAKPTSGLTQTLTRANTRKLASNRGVNWSMSTIQSTTATELLFLVEYAAFNMQEKIGIGVTNKTDDGSTNLAENTGATSSLGNASGSVTNSNGFNVISYRGEENPFGNIWKWVDGINIYNYGEGSVHIADHDFADNKKDGAYQDAGITISGANSYVSAFAYNENFDWLFLASECSGNSSLPVGDYFYQNKASNQYTVAILGGNWYSGSNAGGFCWVVNYASSSRHRIIGGRLLYVPDGTDEFERHIDREDFPSIPMRGINESVYDYVEQTDDGRWLLHKRVGEVDLGTLTWTATSHTSGKTYQRANVTNKEYGLSNIMCSVYEQGASTVADTQDKTIAGRDTSKEIIVYDSAYTDASAFKSAMNGVTLLYELASEQIIDVTSDFADFDNILQVEDGGTITFKNADEQMRIPSPNKMTYVVRVN